MYGFEGWLAVPVALLVGGEVDAGRLQILATEAAGVARTVPGPAAGVAWGWVLLFTFTALAGSFGGSWIGTRRAAHARIRESNGWREVTYRFRSANPLRLTGDVFQRLTSILSELEELGTRIRSSSPGRGSRKAAKSGAPGDHGPAPERPQQKKKKDVAPVKFSRRVEPEPRRRALSPSTDSSPAKRRRESAASPSEAPPPRGEARGPRGGEDRGDRHAKIQRARRLLGEGHDPTIVREITGLKLAELDLIGASTPAPAPVPAEAILR